MTARTTLTRALAMTEPGGYIRAFVDEGPTMERLLYETAVGGMASDYIARLLAAFPVAEHSELNTTLLEPLSPRECELLTLIAEGLTNREIASRLFLSLNTVKAHTHNIYGKLGVNSRTQAVAKANTLGLL